MAVDRERLDRVASHLRGRGVERVDRSTGALVQRILQHQSRCGRVGALRGFHGHAVAGRRLQLLDARGIPAAMVRWIRAPPATRHIGPLHPDGSQRTAQRRGSRPFLDGLIGRPRGRRLPGPHGGSRRGDDRGHLDPAPRRSRRHSLLRTGDRRPGQCLVLDRRVHCHGLGRGARRPDEHHADRGRCRLELPLRRHRTRRRLEPTRLRRLLLDQRRRTPGLGPEHPRHHPHHQRQPQAADLLPPTRVRGRGRLRHRRAPAHHPRRRRHRPLRQRHRSPPPQHRRRHRRRRHLRQQGRQRRQRRRQPPHPHHPRLPHHRRHQRHHRLRPLQLPQHPQPQLRPRSHRHPRHTTHPAGARPRGPDADRGRCRLELPLRRHRTRRRLEPTRLRRLLLDQRRRTPGLGPEHPRHHPHHQRQPQAADLLPPTRVRGRGRLRHRRAPAHHPRRRRHRPLRQRHRSPPPQHRRRHRRRRHLRQQGRQRRQRRRQPPHPHHPRLPHHRRHQRHHRLRPLQLPQHPQPQLRPRSHRHPRHTTHPAGGGPGARER